MTEVTKSDVCQCGACTPQTRHMSDCAVHNSEDVGVGPCDCGAGDCTDKNEALAKALMALNSPDDWETIAPAYRDAWRKKARLIQDALAKDDFYITND